MDGVIVSQKKYLTRMKNCAIIAVSIPVTLPARLPKKSNQKFEHEELYETQIHSNHN